MDLTDVILRGLRADQPLAADVPAGTLYFVTDELVTERSNQSAWQSYSSTDAGITQLTGDVTAGPGSGVLASTIANSAITTAKINAAAVTYAKLQNISATVRILGRKTAGAGSAEECTLSDILDFLGSAAQGDVLFRGASGWQYLAPGTSGQFLKTQGASADVEWDDAGGGGGDIWPKKQYNARPTGGGTLALTDWNGSTGSTAAGSVTNPGASANGTFLRSTSVASSGSSAGWRWHTGTATEALSAPLALPKVKFQILTGSDITNVRYFIGLRTAAATPSGDTENNMAIFRFSTNVPDSQWTALVIDNSGNVHSANAGAIAASTLYDLEVEWVDSSNIKFTVNGVSTTVNTSQQPTANMTPHCTVTTLSASSKIIDFFNMNLESL